MNTMHHLSYALRGLAIAGLCAAGLAAAAPEQARPSARPDIELLNLQPNAAAPTFIAPPPLLVAPTCGSHCMIRSDLMAPSAPLLVAPRVCGGGCISPSPGLMAPSEPLLVAPRGCGGGCTTPSPGLMAPSAPLLVAPRGCGASCQDPSDVEYAWKYRTPLQLAGGDPTIVRDQCASRRCVG